MRENNGRYQEELEERGRKLHSDALFSAVVKILSFFRSNLPEMVTAKNQTSGPTIQSSLHLK